VSQRLRTRTLVALCGTEFAVQGALVVPAVVGLQLRVATFDDDLSPESRLSWVTTVGPIAAMVATILAGWLSDRTARRRGHRGPWIVGGAVVGAAAILAGAHAPNLPLLVLAWAGAQAAYGATFAALFGAIADVVGPVDRARMSGWFAAAGIGALAVGALLAAAILGGHVTALGTSTAAFVVLAVLAVPVAVLTARHLSSLAPRPAAAGEPVRPPGGRAVLRTLIGAGAPFWWLLLQRLVVQAAYTCLTVYGVLFRSDVPARTTGTPPSWWPP
jgi:MFS family permease